MRIGIDLGGTNVRVALVDNNGIVNFVKEPSKADKSVDETVEHIKKLIRQVITPEVKGIGIGVPSVVDPVKGIVYNAANIASWKEVHIKDILEQEFKVPTYVNNDANCFALGEKYFGAGKPYKDVVGITIGTGVGAGLVFNGELYIGSNTGAGEIGEFPYKDYNYEAYCSSGYFSREHDTMGAETYAGAENGNQEALAIWRKFGEHMGSLMSVVLLAYDPQIIVLGGSISTAYRFFKGAMFDKLNKDFPYPEVLKNIVIEISAVEEVGILGAASLVPNK